MKTATKKQIKRSSPLSDSRVVNRRGFERTRGVCGRLWVSKLGRHPPPGHPLIYHGRRPQLSTTNKRRAVWATCHRAFNCLFLPTPLPPHLATPYTHLFLSYCLSLLSSTPVSLASHFSLPSPFSFSLFLMSLSISDKLYISMKEKNKTFIASRKNMFVFYTFKSYPLTCYISIFEHIFLCVLQSNTAGKRGCWFPYIYFPCTNPPLHLLL